MLTNMMVFFATFLNRNHELTIQGVPGVTQCPIAPGESMTYKFRAEQYGTVSYLCTKVLYILIAHEYLDVVSLAYERPGC